MNYPTEMQIKMDAQAARREAEIRCEALQVRGQKFSAEVLAALRSGKTVDQLLLAEGIGGA